MSLYGIRTKRGGRLMSVIGGVTVGDDSGSGPAVERGLSLVASVIVGDFGRGALFCTQDRSLADRLLATGEGEAVGDRISLRPPFAMTLEDLEVVDLASGLSAGTAAAAEASAGATVVPLHPGLAAAA